MNISQSLQFSILNALLNSYPDNLDIDDIPHKCEEDCLQANLSYLSEHGLIIPVATRKMMSKSSQPMITAKITASGIDFLKDDGGLTAILNAITVRLHPDDLCKLLSERIDKLNIPKEKRSTIISTIKSLPAEALKKVYMRLIVAGLDHAPDAYHLLQTYLEKQT